MAFSTRDELGRRQVDVSWGDMEISGHGKTHIQEGSNTISITKRNQRQPGTGVSALYPF